MNIEPSRIVLLKHKSGLIRSVKVGICWTALFLGGVVYLIRGIEKRAVFWIILMVLTLGLSNLILMFTINKNTALYFLENGYKPIGDNWSEACAKWDILTLR